MNYKYISHIKLPHAKVSKKPLNYRGAAPEFSTYEEAKAHLLRHLKISIKELERVYKRVLSENESEG